MFFTIFKTVSNIFWSSSPTHGYFSKRSSYSLRIACSIDASVNFLDSPIWGGLSWLMPLFGCSLGNDCIGAYCFLSGSNIPNSSLMAVATLSGIFIFSNSESVAILSASGVSYQFFFNLHQGMVTLLRRERDTCRVCRAACWHCLAIRTRSLCLLSFLKIISNVKWSIVRVQRAIYAIIYDGVTE